MYIGLASILWKLANSEDPDQTLHNAMSDQDLQSLLTACSIKRKSNSLNAVLPIKMARLKFQGKYFH